MIQGTIIGITEWDELGQWLIWLQDLHFRVRVHGIEFRVWGLEFQVVVHQRQQQAKGNA